MIATRILAAAGACAALLVAAPALAQTAGHSAVPHHAAAPHHGTTQHHGGARPAQAHGATSHHATPGRHHATGQQVRTHGRGDPEAVQVDQLNQMSLERAQGTAAPAPAAPR